MHAVWYDRKGPAGEVLEVGELPTPEPGPGEVRVRLTFSGINPGDTKKRSAWLDSPMPYPRVIPHSDGAGVIDAVGAGVDATRVGRRVWVYDAQSYRPFGTAAQFTVVPDRTAVELPDNVPDELGACLGIPGITAHRAVSATVPSPAPPSSSTASSVVWAVSSPRSPPPPATAPSPSRSDTRSRSPARPGPTTRWTPAPASGRC